MYRCARMLQTLMHGFDQAGSFSSLDELGPGLECERHPGIPLIEFGHSYLSMAMGRIIKVDQVF